jgi:hypothetical protein
MDIFEEYDKRQQHMTKRTSKDTPERMKSIEQYLNCMKYHANDFDHRTIPFGVESHCNKCDTTWIIHVKKRIGDV